MSQEYHIVFDANSDPGAAVAIGETTLALRPDELPGIIAVFISAGLSDYNDYLYKESVASSGQKGFRRRYRSILSGLTT